VVRLAERLRRWVWGPRPFDPDYVSPPFNRWPVGSPIGRVLVWADRHGLRETERFVKSSINRKLVLSDGRREIEVLCDRGDWSLGLGVSWMVESFSPDEWETWAAGRPLELEPSDLDHQVEFTVSQWTRVVDRAERTPSAEQELVERGREWVERFFNTPD
jgi:hypothetical protein